MSILFQLYFVFFKIGLFGFGGGYAMIGMMQSEIISLNWIEQSEFIKMIAVAEMTPGPISVNLATYVGFKLGGFLGAFIATAGVATPSVLLLIVISNFLFSNYDHPAVKLIFQYIKPVIAGLILSAALKISYVAFVKEEIATPFGTLMKSEQFNLPDFLNEFHFTSIFTFALVLLLHYGLKKKIHPIHYIIFSGVIGIFIFHFFS